MFGTTTCAHRVCQQFTFLAVVSFLAGLGNRSRGIRPSFLGAASNKALVFQTSRFADVHRKKEPDFMR